MNRTFLLIALLTVTVSCSIPTLDRVLSDERTQYEKSQSLPPLDVPPDLSANEPNDAMTIPGETTSATLKDYQTRTQQGRAAPVTQNTPAPQSTPQVQTWTTATAAATAGAGPFVAVRGDKAGIWSKLRTFVIGKGYQIDLDDMELGYLETHWSLPLQEGGVTSRFKFKFYSEAGEQPDVTVLYIDNVRQEQVVQSNGNYLWIDRDKSTDAERLMAGEMNMYFNGRQQQIVASSSTATAPIPAAPEPEKRLAEIQDIGDDKILLAIPEEYSLAWRRTEQALQQAGLVINSKDQERGLYRITLYDNEKKEGWTSKLKKLKFWGSDEPEGTVYQVALTGVGKKTELVLLDADGEWENVTAAERILSMILTQYNRLINS